MLTKEQLVLLQAPPKLSDISLETLAEFYETYLCPNRYIYTFDSGLSIELNFHEADMCHLLGLAHVNQKIKGLKSFQDIKDGKISFDKLKSMNKREFKNLKNRFRYFVYIKRLVESPSIIKFNYTIVRKTKIVCEFILYDDYNNSIVHLGIESSNGKFYPKSLLIEVNMGDKFIKDQEHMKLDRVEIMPKHSNNVAESC